MIKGRIPAPMSNGVENSLLWVTKHGFEKCNVNGSNHVLFQEASRLWYFSIRDRSTEEITTRNISSCSCFVICPSALMMAFRLRTENPNKPSGKQEIVSNVVYRDVSNRVFRSQLLAFYIYIYCAGGSEDSNTFRSS